MVLELDIFDRKGRHMDLIELAESATLGDLKKEFHRRRTCIIS